MLFHLPFFSTITRLRRHGRKCLLVLRIASATSQSSANLVINNLGPSKNKALGYDTRDQLILQAGWITVGIPFNTLGSTHSFVSSDYHTCLITR
jgi:hypothetical protein